MSAKYYSVRNLSELMLAVDDAVRRFGCGLDFPKRNASGATVFATSRAVIILAAEEERIEFVNNRGADDADSNEAEA